ncbi:hypothetical protein [Neisseria dumasiana]|uniref:hypothetical protein n=1 Tax=Neisseria dumasiana TaxID=1931275 RepID=UPI000A195443|nr:hypothetical protein [Neisseria dumasiana]
MEPESEQILKSKRMGECKDNINAALMMLQSISELVAGYNGDAPLDMQAFYFVLQSVEQKLKPEVDYLQSI